MHKKYCNSYANKTKIQITYKMIKSHSSADMTLYRGYIADTDPDTAVPVVTHDGKPHTIGNWYRLTGFLDDVSNVLEWCFRGTLYNPSIHRVAVVKVSNTDHYMELVKFITPDEVMTEFACVWLDNVKHKVTDVDESAILAAHTQLWTISRNPHRGGDKPAVIDENGMQEWWSYGLRHRDDDKPAIISMERAEDWVRIRPDYRCLSEPAVLWVTDILPVQHCDDHSGLQTAVTCHGILMEWWKDGGCHRDNDLPAVTCPDGTREWWKNGVCCRDNDLPAIIYMDGTKEWMKGGERHRDNNLPAIIHANGTMEWFRYGHRHRDADEPAIVRLNGTLEWFVDGVHSRSGGLPAITRSNGTQEWWVTGKRHRDGDLPAVEYANKHREWWVGGKRHRVGNPAIIHANGKEEWRVNGLRHREDGPAVVGGEVKPEWWINGERWKECCVLQTCDCLYRKRRHFT